MKVKFISSMFLFFVMLSTINYPLAMSASELSPNQGTDGGIQPRRTSCQPAKRLYASNRTVRFRNPEFGNVRRNAASYSFSAQKGNYLTYNLGVGPVGVSYSKGTNGGGVWSVGANSSRLSTVDMLQTVDVYRHTNWDCSTSHSTVLKSERAIVNY
jgi:hypothetical protein